MITRKIARFALLSLACAAAIAGSLASCTRLESAPASSVTTYTVTPSGTYVTVSPSSAQTVTSGATTSFTVTASTGYSLSSTVGGTCAAGSWSSGVYTTGLVTADCAVSFSGAWSSTKQIGAAGGSVLGFGVAVDSSGNVIMAGQTDRGLHGNTVTGSQDLFVVKYDSTGTRQWTQQLGVAAADTIPQATAVDTSSAVYVAGYTSGSLDGQVLTGGEDIFITKYNSAGTKQWTKLLGVAGAYAGALGATTDSTDNVIVSGYTDIGLDGNGQTGAYDFVVAKYDSSGTKQWVKQLGVAAVNTYGQAVTTDSSDNVYVAGYTQGALDGETLTGSIDLFVTKYNSAGTKQWTRLLGVAAKSTIAYGVTTDSSGNVYAVGETSGALDAQVLTGSKDLFIVKYNSAGTKQWTKLLGVAAVDTVARSVSVDSSGNVLVGGHTKGNLDSNTLAGAQDFFVASYDSSGTKQWVKILGVATKTTYGMGVKVDSSGNAFIGGYTNGGLDGNTLTGTQDAYLTKYNSSGTKQ